MPSLESLVEMKATLSARRFLTVAHLALNLSEIDSSDARNVLRVNAPVACLALNRILAGGLIEKNEQPRRSRRVTVKYGPTGALEPFLVAVNREVALACSNFTVSPVKAVEKAADTVYGNQGTELTPPAFIPELHDVTKRFLGLNAVCGTMLADLNRIVHFALLDSERG